MAVSGRKLIDHACAVRLHGDHFVTVLFLVVLYSSVFLSNCLSDCNKHFPIFGRKVLHMCSFNILKATGTQSFSLSTVLHYSLLSCISCTRWVQYDLCSMLSGHEAYWWEGAGGTSSAIPVGFFYFKANLCNVSTKLVVCLPYVSEFFLLAIVVLVLG